MPKLPVNQRRLPGVQRPESAAGQMAGVESLLVFSNERWKEMKNAIIALLTTLIFTGCKVDPSGGMPTKMLNPKNVIEVEGCEYYVIDAFHLNTYTYTHKGNCKNPIHQENRK